MGYKPGEGGVASEQNITMFIGMYGPLWAERGAFATPFTASGTLHEVAVKLFLDYQQQLRNAWALLARDLAEGRAKVCRNPECATPFFVKRSDAQFCSHKCAVDVNNVAYRPRRQRLAEEKKNRKNRRKRGERKS
jgi:hypothetical protein